MHPFLIHKFCYNEYKRKREYSMATCFFDIDGTIAEDGVLVDGILESFQQLQANGHRVFICTGRAFHYVDSIFHGYVNGYITSNGRCGYINNQRVFHQPLKQEDRKKYAQMAREHKALVIFQGAYKRFIQVADQSLYQSLKESLFLPEVDILQCQDVYNFNTYYQQDDVLCTLRKLWKDEIILNDHHNHQSADASICSFDKGKGVQFMIAHLHERYEDTYAFGDGENDLAMFASCAHRIAMRNGVEALKEKATYISDHYQKQGVIKALYHYQLLK